jgi:excisionase family DNA binding protein
MATIVQRAPETVSVEEAASVLGISRRSAYRYAKSGQLPVVRLGGRILVPRYRLLELLAGERRCDEPEAA